MHRAALKLIGYIQRYTGRSANTGFRFRVDEKTDENEEEDGLRTTISLAQ